MPGASTEESGLVVNPLTSIPEHLHQSSKGHLGEDYYARHVCLNCGGHHQTQCDGSQPSPIREKTTCTIRVPHGFKVTAKGPSKTKGPGVNSDKAL